MNQDSQITGRAASSSSVNSKSAVKADKLLLAQLVEGSALPPDKQPLRFKTVAQITDVSVKTVRRWTERGWLNSFKLGGVCMIFMSDLMSFIDRCAAEGNKQQA